MEKVFVGRVLLALVLALVVAVLVVVERLMVV
jgi:hypothetical protein